MNLKYFEQQIEKKILNRGFDYYESDNIEGVEQVDALEFSATIHGTEEYSVFIKLSRDLKILEHDCDCPYDWGDVCKHKVAVLYYIRDAELYKYSPEGKGKLGKLRDDLKELTRSELLNFIMNCAKKDKRFRAKIWEELGYDDNNQVFT